MWVTVGEPVFLHMHTCSIFKFSRRPRVYKILVMAVHRARARAANAPTAKFPSFFRFSTSQKGAFHQIVKKSLNLPYKKVIFFLKGYESVKFCLRRARPVIRRPWTCSRSHTYMHHSNPQYDLWWPEDPPFPKSGYCR